MDETTYDVVVIGGGAAGLSGALALGRARRSVLVVDAGEPRNAPADAVHNYLGREGTPPAELRAIGRAEVAQYGVQVRSGTATGARRDLDGFVVDVDGAPVRARRLLVTTGLVDQLPDLPGVREAWGRTVLHCPYCHGWEVRDRALGVLATSPMSVHQALLFRQWSADVALFVHTAAAPTDQQREQLAARGVAVVEGEAVAWEDGGVRLADGTLVERDALVVAPTFTARSALLEQLGLATEDLLLGDHVVGTRVVADRAGLTGVPGVWVAGNVTDLQAQVVTSAAAGLMAGAALNADLVEEDTRHAVELARVTGREAWEARYRSRDAVWSGRPNEVLVTETSDLPTGRALDVGCGEGGDAIWLASRGWQVTATDLSSVALSRAEAAAAERGLSVDWQQGDASEQLPSGTYDLVTASFLHVPAEVRDDLHRRLAAAVAVGGMLLVVAHDPLDQQEPAFRQPALGSLMTSAPEVAAVLDPDDWVAEVVEARPRPAHGRDGQPATRHDAVLRARRVR